MDSALVVGLTCCVGCSTRADQRVLSAARSSLLQSAKPGADCRRNGLSTGGGTHLPCGLQYQG
ncbi:unnamed protein product [Staurois parvus]|uniref:Secreted protein n=1 Tax=Staurois parvus TaxID=386267 RepID=A0ABN9HK22_9NEOB|nr:unnamed protein product [Staurois parvus]